VSPAPVGPETHASSSPAGPPYAELHCRTNFSFLEGASHPDELVQQAALLGYAALAITDRNSLAGVVRAHAAAKEVGLKLLIGAEITPVDAPPVLLLAMHRAGYARLCRLLTLGRRRAPKGECRLTFDDLAQHAEGLIACVPLLSLRSDESRKSAHGRVPIADCDFEISDLKSEMLQRYRELFPDRCYSLVELHHGPDDPWLLQRMLRIAHRAKVPAVAANDVHYHVPGRRRLHDVLNATRHGCTVAELGEQRFPNAQRYLKAPREMAALFAACPEVVPRTVEIADRCTFSLDELRYEYPRELSPAGTTPLEYLTQLTWAGAQQRYPQGLPEKVRGLIEHELQLIAELRYEAYFLTVWDLVRFARSRGILCQGRGSAANSAVCYCLEVTSVDPDFIDVLFERFVSKERNEAPDIDVDFEHERREEVIQYVYEKYGRERAGMAATVITYRPRSAIRDVGKALGLSLDRVDAIATTMEPATGEDRFAGRLRGAGLDPTSVVGQQLSGLVGELLGFPRHLSQHVGGLVLTNGPLCELVPIENAAMPGRTVIQWDKDDLDALGLLKVDCLSLGMLTAIRKCFTLIEQQGGPALTLATVPPEDPDVYGMIQQADTMGVFQIESRAQMSMLPRLRPAKFYDLVIEVAIVRPGPIQGDMVHPYLRRRRGDEPVDYPDERIREVLDKTLGVPIFQEQAMRLAVVAAGFTPGEADQLRRAMAAWRRPGVLDAFERKLIDGMVSRGYSGEFAARVFKQIRGFGEYGFPESHAASFARLVYVSSWQKHHYPAAFAAGLLNSQPMGFYAPAQLILDARRHGVEVRPVDVNASQWDCTLENESHIAVGGRGWTERSEGSPGANDAEARIATGRSQISDRGWHDLRAAMVVANGESAHEKQPDLKDAIRHPPSFSAIRLGMRMIRGFSERHARLIVDRRGDRPFTSFADFVRRTRLSNAVLKLLSEADAFGSLRLNRRTALWQSLPSQQQLPLFDNLADEEPPAALPPLTLQDQVAGDYRTAGMSLRGHPLQFVREQLERRGIVAASDLAQLPVDRRYRVAGLVLLRQRPGTAKGITFVTIEDETGPANLIIRQEVWERHRRVASSANAIVAHGALQRVEGVIHLLVDRLQDLRRILGDVDIRSRDFR